MTSATRKRYSPFDKFDGLLRPPDTTELNRMHAVVAESNSIGRFLDWFIEKFEGEEYEGEITIGDICPDKLLHEYFQIDAEKIEQERREVLAHQRLLNTWVELRKELGVEDAET